MSQSCAANKCNRTSRGVCDCCQQNLCLQHLTEHNASLLSQLDPLTDQINELDGRLKSLNIEQAFNYRQKLEEWRDDCHQKIERLFERKSKQLDRLIDEKIKKHQKEIREIQARIGELIREEEATRQDIDSLTSTIQQLKEEMDKIGSTRFNIDTRPLIIDEKAIDLKESDELDISSISPICKTIDRLEESSKAFASNDRLLLIHQAPNLCLFSPEMNLSKQTSWPHGQINDMCWSETLNRFFVIGKDVAFLVNEDALTIDSVPTIPKRKWLSGTCSDTALFLVTNEVASSVVKFTLRPKIELSKEWKSPQTCSRYEHIDDINYDCEKLCLMIWNINSNSLRIELKYIETLATIWSLQLDDANSQKIAFRCCSFPGNEWLVVQHATGSLLQITKDGKLKKVIKYERKSVPCWHYGTKQIHCIN